MILAGLEATLQIHLESRTSDLLVWRFLERTAEECHHLALQLADGVPHAQVKKSYSLVGGGALPERRLPTWVVSIQSNSIEELAKNLRVGSPSIMPRIQNDAVLLDVRTLKELDIPLVQQRLQELLK